MAEGTKKNTKKNYEYRLTLVNRVLCKIAGSDLSILIQCPHEISRHARIGAVILLTAIVSSFSMFMAIQTITKSNNSALIVGIVWGILIFTLDSYIVSSYKKNDEKSIEFKIMIPRLFLAIILGFTISIPLELKAFSNEIFEEIKLIKQEEESKNQIKANEIYEKQLLPLKNQKDIFKKRFEELLKPLSKKDSSIQVLEELKILELAGAGPSGNRGRGIVVINLESRIENLKTEKLSLPESASIVGVRKELMRIDSLISATPKPNPEKIGDLFGILVQLDALKRITSKSTYAFIAYWAFFLLVLAVETAPILVKFFTPKGSYDIIFAMNETLIIAKQQQRKVVFEENLKSDNEAISSINSKRKQAQDIVNGKLINVIADAQGEIAEKAIDIWKNKQFEKVEEDIDKFISTEPPSA